MKKVSVIYWSGTGNTEAMANAVAEGVKEGGGEVALLPVSLADLSSLDADALVFGCPAMGAEELEESEFEPFFSAAEGKLSGKKVGLFGSYGWGDGEWMRNWEDTCKGDGANLVCESVICNDAPDDDALEACKKLGASLA